MNYSEEKEYKKSKKSLRREHVAHFGLVGCDSRRRVADEGGSSRANRSSIWSLPGARLLLPQSPLPVRIFVKSEVPSRFHVVLLLSAS